MSYFFHGPLITDNLKLNNSTAAGGIVLQSNVATTSSYNLIFPAGITGISSDHILGIQSISGSNINLDFSLKVGPTGASGQDGQNGQDGLMGSAGVEGSAGAVSYYIFDGGDPDTNYEVGPAFDCGAVDTGTVNIQFQLRRGTETGWGVSDPVLADGEVGYDKTNKWFKIGNGVDTWSELRYANRPAIYTILVDGIPATNGNTTITGGNAINTWSATYTASGGRLDISCYVTFYVSATGFHDYALYEDTDFDNPIKTASFYFNATSTHMAATPLFVVLSTRSGVHQYSVRLMDSASFCDNDTCTIKIIEF